MLIPYEEIKLKNAYRYCQLIKYIYIMGRLIVGKTKMCCVGKCEKEAVKWDGFLLKSRDAVSAGFCEKHWFLTPCPNFKNIKNCFGIYDKGLGLI